jgi:hypothetical protein
MYETRFPDDRQSGLGAYCFYVFHPSRLKLFGAAVRCWLLRNRACRSQWSVVLGANEDLSIGLVNTSPWLIPAQRTPPGRPLTPAR